MGAQAVRLSNIDIDNALENKDFEVLFQPIFDLGNGALARMETFVRWRHPDLGVLPPGAFISFFESQGRMSELTRYVLAEALTGYMQWRGAFAPGFSINLALTDLADDAFATHFTKLLRDREFPPDLVTLECPMPAVDADPAQATAQYARLRQTGARLAIEVRGRANEFLRAMDPFPFDEIKTGGSSILRFARTVRGPGLSAISDLLDIANAANAAITAVGVEDQASLAALRGLGFTAAQGNHLGKVGGLKDFLPSRVNEVRDLLGLSPLTSDDLTALFRTSAPEPKAAEAAAQAETQQSKAAAPAAQAKTPEENDASKAPAEEKPQAAASNEEAQKRARAREKAKALALAKRAKAREARKAAAIKRAKAKAAEARRAQAQAETGETSDAQPGALAAVPRDLQERLAQEFSGPPEDRAASEQKPEAQSDIQHTESPASADTGERAAAQSSEPAAPAPQPLQEEIPLAAAAGDGLMAAKDAPAKTVHLGASAARAHFRPGVRIGGPALNPQINTSATRRAAPNAPIDASPPAAPKREEPPQPQRTFGKKEEERRAAETPVQPDNAGVQGHLLEENNTVAAEKPAPPRPRRKQTNFLTRKYRVRLPDHFWPKSWKRRLARLKTARTEHAAE